VTDAQPAAAGAGAPLAGVVPIVPTPFKPDGTLDLASLRRVVEYLIGEGVHGLAVLGVAGEGFALTDAERIAVIATAVEQAAGRLPVAAGSSHASAEAAAALARGAEAAGAETLLVMPPAFVKPSEDAIVEYFTAVAGAVSVPVMIQDNPGWTAVTIPLAAYRALAAVENVRYAKVEVPHPPSKIRELRAALGDGLTIFGGLAGNWLLEELAAGSLGTMPASIMPEVYVGVWERWQAGDVAGARELFNRSHPLIRLTGRQAVGFALVKHALWRLGVLDSPRVRNPVPPLTAADVSEFEAALGEAGLLPAGPAR
jgi:4-hydroxy-tetrahydrodipicolinate synthase